MARSTTTACSAAPATTRCATSRTKGHATKTRSLALQRKAARRPLRPIVSVLIIEGELDKLDDLALLPGMPAQVFIVSGERTAMSHMYKPLTDGLARAL
ncbi:MAG: hypothetical protein MJA83_01360 [Gammaproteobacteria bacterium]|nr:hypothetical protein [Gammaproteobacteria bacterium]